MTPADHSSFHSHHLPPPKDCSNLFSPTHCNNPTSSDPNFNILNVNNSSNTISGGGTNHNSNNSNIHPNNNNNNINHNHNMGGQTPVFFAPSNFIVNHAASAHKTSCQELHEAMLAKQQHQLLSRGPLQLVDFKDVVGGGPEGGSGGGSCGTGGEQIRMGKRPHIRFASGSQEYDPGPASARSSGEDQMSMEYMDHMDAGGEYMDHLEGGVGELMKKGSRRLGYDQVKALEKAFEVENRLEPERKVRLASQLGLQPRQVAVWFQNRRARWKTKQMERDYTLLKNKFEALKADRDKLLQEKDHLQAELARLKGHAVMEGVLNMGKQAIKVDQQDSPTLASCSLVDDAAPASHVLKSKQGTMSHREDDQLEEEEEGEELEEEEASPKPTLIHEQKLLQNDSLSSTEDSDINNDGAIVDSTSKAFQEETDFYAQHWRLPPAPAQLVYKPTTIKTEEWPEQGENMASFNMTLDTNWYNW